MPASYSLEVREVPIWGLFQFVTFCTLNVPKRQRDLFLNDWSPRYRDCVGTRCKELNGAASEPQTESPGRLDA